MKSKLSMLSAVVMCFAMIGMAAPTTAQDRDVPETELSAPSLPTRYSKEASKIGLAATAAKKVVVARGGWCLSLTVGESTECAFEYVSKGFCSKVKYLGSQGSGINQFLYYKVEGWRIVMAIRNQSTGGTHDMYFFVNGSSDPTTYGKGKAYDPS